MQLFCAGLYTTIDGVELQVDTAAVAFVRRANDKKSLCHTQPHTCQSTPALGRRAAAKNKCPRAQHRPGQDNQQKQKP